MSTMAPLALAATEPPAEITVVVKADGSHNPYMASGFGGIGKSWLATLTNKDTKATFTVQVCVGQGTDEPPTGGQVCHALQADIGLSALPAADLARHFGYPPDGHGLAEGTFIKGVLGRRAAGAIAVGMNTKKVDPKKAQAQQAAAAPAHAVPAPVAPAQRTRKKNSDAPAAIPPPPPPPPPGRKDVAAVLDF